MHLFLVDNSFSHKITKIFSYPWEVNPGERKMNFCAKLQNMPYLLNISDAAKCALVSRVNLAVDCSVFPEVALLVCSASLKISFTIQKRSTREHVRVSTPHVFYLL